MFSVIFTQVADIATGAKARRQEEMAEFLKLHRQLVETVPAEVAKMFGDMTTTTIHRGASHSYGIELNVTDHLWWIEIVEEGGYFRDGVAKVKAKMLKHLVKQIEETPLEPKERKKLLALLDEGAE